MIGLPTGRPPSLGRWKVEVRERLGLDPDDLVLISALHCAEPDCPPIETVIVVMSDAGARTWKLPIAPEELTSELLARSLTDNPNGTVTHND